MNDDFFKKIKQEHEKEYSKMNVENVKKLEELEKINIKLNNIINTNPKIIQFESLLNEFKNKSTKTNDDIKTLLNEFRELKNYAEVSIDILNNDVDDIKKNDVDGIKKMT